MPLLLVVFTPGVYDGFFKFLVWTSALNSALAGIGVADYFILRRQRLDLRALHSTASDSAYGFWRGFNPIGLFSLAVGLRTNSQGLLLTFGAILPRDAFALGAHARVDTLFILFRKV